MLKIGIGQMHVDAGNPEYNIGNAAGFIQKAAKLKCDVIVLPECLDLGWTNSSAWLRSQPIPGIYSRVLQDAAQKNHIHVVAGLTEREGNAIYNSAILIDPSGAIIGKHRKINILDIAEHMYTPGNSCQVFETNLGRIGINICADNDPATNELGHTLAYLGAEIILSPCSWAVPPDFNQEKTPYGDIWKRSYRQIAEKHQVPVIGVSNTGAVKDGDWKGWWCIGSSLVVSADGKIQKQFPYSQQGNDLFTLEVQTKKSTK